MLIKQKGYMNVATKTVESTDEYVDIQGLASTVYKDRDGDVVSPVGIDLTNFNKNPIVLFNHNWDKPIGKTLSTEITPEGLQVVIRVFKNTDPAIFAAVKSGVLSTFSIGFIGKDGRYDEQTDTYYFTDIELYEISIVSIPANQDAIFEVIKSPDCENGVCKLKGMKKEDEKDLQKELDEIKSLLQTLLGQKEADSNVAQSDAIDESQEVSQVEEDTDEDTTIASEDGQEVVEDVVEEQTTTEPIDILAELEKVDINTQIQAYYKLEELINSQTIN